MQTTCDPSVARSFLFVPGNRPDRLDKAVAGDADVVIADLEDSIGRSNKAEARRQLGGWSWSSSADLLVRINSVASEHFDADVATVAGLRGVAGVVVPKTESPDQISAVQEVLPDIPLIALVESALGMHRVVEIASSGVVRLMFGSADYLADIGGSSCAEVLALPRSMLVLASTIAGLPAPVDGPAVNFEHDVTTEGEALLARALGMGGKLCIHPRQVAIVNQAFAYTPEDVEWANAVLRAVERSEGDVTVVDGAMVDEPTVRRARRILDLS